MIDTKPRDAGNWNVHFTLSNSLVVKEQKYTVETEIYLFDPKSIPVSMLLVVQWVEDYCQFHGRVLNDGMQ